MLTGKVIVSPLASLTLTLTLKSLPTIISSTDTISRVTGIRSTFPVPALTNSPYWSLSGSTAL